MENSRVKGWNADMRLKNVFQKDMKQQFTEKGYQVPTYDREKIVRATVEEPTWLHFGTGNIFRAFPSAILDSLLNQRLFAAYAKEILKEETHYEMPCPVSADYRDNVIRIRMSHMNLPKEQNVRGIIVKSGENRLTVLQAWAKEDILKITLKEKAKETEPDKVVVYYDWYDAPEYTDLRNEYGVISGSFRIECNKW